MINLSNLSKAYGATTLFDDVNISFNPGKRYGLTGPNGAGKSTLMRILCGAEVQDSGQLSIPDRLGILRQDQNAFDAFNVMDTVLQGNQRLFQANQEKEALYAKGELLTDADGERLGELEMIVAEEDGYTADSDAAQLLLGLGVPSTLHYQAMDQLPSAKKVRVLLAQALFGTPDALLLDEPTNHLDMDSIKWLEKFLLQYQGTLVVISHDRHFLNSVCTHTADIDYETIILYPGNYDLMVEAKLANRGREETDAAQRQAQIKRLNEFIQRFRAGSRSSQVKSRERQVAKLTPQELKKSNIARPFIRFKFEQGSGRDVFRLENATLTRPPSHPGEAERVVLKKEDLHVGRGERIAIIGPSGSGKTRLLELLADKVKPETGRLVPGHNVHLGLYDTEKFNTIEPGKNLLGWLHDKKPTADEESVRGFLGRMLFSKDDALKSTENLSGGERARLLFSELMLLEYNTLLFDEPTNHLDLEAISAFGDGLADFRGTCAVVTHDQDLIDRFATRIWAFEDGQFVDFLGNWQEYLRRQGLGEPGAAQGKGGKKKKKKKKG
ncbi:MAG: ATP-binding cassette domain-containing protein [Myxococcota bacterium]|jgi:ATPase subunit of ABC transporter with duplicated ATPase domains|nr:ATP-binding cassette domain-containing protein [Myxococcota bacterium]|tara:strand:- start:868 stop:2529 length:1662 start_codon:yes stop_codon:yes gene_type:complete